MKDFIFILLVWIVVICFIIKQYYDDKPYPNKPKIILYITWFIMFMIGVIATSTALN